jgi:hypothetical protein
VSGLSYFTADNCAVLAENKTEDVQKLAQHMNFPPLNQTFEIVEG